MWFAFLKSPSYSHIIKSKPKSPNLQTNRVWWLGFVSATSSCTNKLPNCRKPTCTFRDGLTPCSIYASYFFGPKELVTNVASKLNGRTRTVILSDDWTICERFWILAVAFGRERERKCSIYLFIFIYLFILKKNSLLIFAHRRNISPKSLVHFTHISNLYKLEYCRSIFLEHIWSASNLAT